MIANEQNVVSGAPANMPVSPTRFVEPRAARVQMGEMPPLGTLKGCARWAATRDQGARKPLRWPLVQASRPRERCDDKSAVARLFASPSGGRPLQALPPPHAFSPNGDDSSTCSPTANATRDAGPSERKVTGGSQV